MPGRRLDPEERALWARVAATVTPLAGRPRASSQAERAPPPPHPGEGRAPPRGGHAADAGVRRVDGKVEAVKPAAPPSDTLDGGWERRLRRGVVAAERSIDLHGHTLASAHAALEAAIERALADEVRVMLVVTGKPPRAGERGRGRIATSIGDWLAHSRHRPRIAAVRGAHPRHGGAGALYLILRRRRSG